MNNTLIQYQGWRVHFLERWLHWEQSSPYIARQRIWRHLSLPGRILNGSVQAFRFESPDHPFLSPTYALSDRELHRLLPCPSVDGSCSFPSLWHTLVVNPRMLNFGLLKKEGAETSRRSGRGCSSSLRVWWPDPAPASRTSLTTSASLTPPPGAPGFTTAARRRCTLMLRVYHVNFP